MKRSAERLKKAATAPGDLHSKLQGMDDKALGNLNANARRLESTGSIAQRDAAAALLPAIDAELSARQANALVAVEAEKAARRERAAAKRALKVKPSQPDRPPNS